MSNQHRLLGSSLIVLAAAVAASAARADDQEQGQLQEIVVTAQKRTESVLKVPIAITAIDQETLNKQGAKDIADLARLAPGLNYQPSDDAGDTTISIRGIQSDVGAATTGIYIDDTPVAARPDAVGANLYPKLFDLDRIEVLKGPQGTLFGAGSEGGTVRFITPDPSLQKFSGFARAELAFTDGGDPSYEAGAAVGGPIVDGKVGFRASAWYREDGGYIDRVSPATGETTATNTNSEGTTVARFALKLAPTDELVIQPALYFQNERSDDLSLYYEATGPFKELTRIPQPIADRFMMPSVTVTYDFGSFNVKSITSYLQRTMNGQYDATNYEVINILGNTNVVPGYPDYLVTAEYHSGQINFSQELRFTSNDDADSPFSWIGGIFYEHARSSFDDSYVDPLFNQLNEIAYGADSLDSWGEAVLPGNVTYLDHFVENETDMAIYANATYKILPDLKASAGVRVARSGFTYLDQSDGPWGPAAPTTFSGSEKETPVTPRFSLSWNLTDDQMLYTTAAKGYRIGGANEPVPASYCAPDLKALGESQVPEEYQSDSVWSYEGGVKGKFLDNTLLLEGSLFWINWDNIQSEVYLPSCAYYYIANLGQAASRGFDLQLEYKATKELTLSGTVGLTDARYTKSLVQNKQLLAKAGDPISGMPEWTFTLSGEYDTEVMPDTDGYLRLDYQYQGPYQRYGSSDTLGYDGALQKGVASHYVTMRAGVKRGGWDVSLFIDNVLNAHPSLFRYRDTITTNYFRDTTFRPLTAGITAQYDF